MGFANEPHAFTPTQFAVDGVEDNFPPCEATCTMGELSCSGQIPIPGVALYVEVKQDGWMAPMDTRRTVSFALFPPDT